MFDHVQLNVADIGKSTRFYAAILEALGFKQLSRDDASASFGVENGPVLYLSRATGSASTGLHIALRARDHGAIDRFHSSGLSAGGRDNGKPGLRKDYSPTYYAAFLIDPDGNNVEAVCA